MRVRAAPPTACTSTAAMPCLSVDREPVTVTRLRVPGAGPHRPHAETSDRRGADPPEPAGGCHRRRPDRAPGERSPAPYARTGQRVAGGYGGPLRRQHGGSRRARRAPARPGASPAPASRSPYPRPPTPTLRRARPQSRATAQREATPPSRSFPVGDPITTAAHDARAAACRRQPYHRRAHARLPSAPTCRRSAEPAHRGRAQPHRARGRAGMARPGPVRRTLVPVAPVADRGAAPPSTHRPAPHARAGRHPALVPPPSPAAGQGARRVRRRSPARPSARRQSRGTRVGARRARAPHGRPRGRRARVGLSIRCADPLELLRSGHTKRRGDVVRRAGPARRRRAPRASRLPRARSGCSALGARDALGRAAGVLRLPPREPGRVHNASLLGASLVHLALGDEHLARDRVARAIDRTLASQRADGSFPYGEDGNLGWADSFHTGFVLGCLHDLRAVDDRIGKRSYAARATTRRTSTRTGARCSTQAAASLRTRTLRERG